MNIGSRVCSLSSLSDYFKLDLSSRRVLAMWNVLHDFKETRKLNINNHKCIYFFTFECLSRTTSKEAHADLLDSMWTCL